MRVISGKYKGKKLDGFNIDGTRPTMDRVKESLFGMIKGYLKDSVSLDLFAGSGALGIEGLSEYGMKCYFVDANIEAIKVLKKNTASIENVYIYHSDFREALLNFSKQKIKFNIIFLDPPYKMHLISEALDLIIKYDLLASDGIVICEAEDEVIKTNLLNIKSKKYGDTNINIYKKEK